MQRWETYRPCRHQLYSGLTLAWYSNSSFHARLHLAHIDWQRSTFITSWNCDCYFASPIANVYTYPTQNLAATSLWVLNKVITVHLHIICWPLCTILYLLIVSNTYCQVANINNGHVKHNPNISPCSRYDLQLSSFPLSVFQYSSTYAKKF